MADLTTNDCCTRRETEPMAHLRITKATRTLLRAVAFAAAAMTAASFASAQQDGTNAWSPFPQQRSNSNETPYDKSFVKDWEANPPKGFPTLSAVNIEPMKAAIQRYAAIAERGGWRQLPEMQLQTGMTHEAVGILRERLLSSGDLKDQSSFPNHYDFYVEKAVKRFQASNGLTPTGVVDKRTVAALNVPAAARLRQLRQNLARL